MRKLSICIETFFTELPFLERIDQVAKRGFLGFEFWEWRGKDLKEVQKKARASGLEIAAISGNRKNSLISPLEREGCVEEVKKSIEVAHQLGCPNLMIVTNKLAENGSVRIRYEYMNAKEKYINVIKSLRELVAIAEKEDILLLLEPLNSLVDHVGYYLDSTKDGFRIIDEVDSENLKLLYDVYHMQIMEGNLINTICENIDKIGYIHIADVPGRHEPDTGEINFRKIYETLVRLKYNRFIGFELIPLTSSIEALEKIKSVFM